MNPCLMIPVYNHEHALPRVLAALAPFGLPCFLIDDGSNAACRQVLETCAREHAAWVTLMTRAENGGKGAAMLDGFRAARAAGFTHALQIDADGQHDAGDVARFLALSRAHPEAVIAGQPLFGPDAPNSRRYGRLLTNAWVWINTLSLAIGDAMCGFRLYPLAAVERVYKTAEIGRRMEFDIDVIVRLYWSGVEVVNVPTQVAYPLDGVSHFRMGRDNLRIAAVHARLFFGMLARLPRLLARHCKR